jgi:predicted outer membrane repeat protein
VSLIQCTLNNNSATNGGGGIYNETGGVSLGNTLLKSASGGNIVNVGGSISSQGCNLSSDNGGGFLTGTGDQINTDPMLDPAGLQNNGGPTQTIALLSGSLAINAGNDTLAPKLDQRGYLRSGVSDIGAFEFGGQPLRITSITRLGGSSIRLDGLGVPNAAHTIEASPDLSPNSFGGIGTATANGAGVLQSDDAGAVGLNKRFYRLVFP